ncbi:DUF2786 domain-containing protein [Pirellulaceae bacterium SH449]
MRFHWNDGGRAAAGFTGFCGDCVTRSISIGTGLSYRTVYDELGEAANKTPRNGLPTEIAASYLSKAGWGFESFADTVFVPETFPTGTFIVHMVHMERRRSGHLTCVIDNMVHDTWNPAEDDSFRMRGVWTSPKKVAPESAEATCSADPSEQASLTQREFEKILRRLRALDNTANNDASTEGEKRNALQMMQALLLQHNLSREDLLGEAGKPSLQLGRFSCVLNSSRACTWEHGVAHYLCEEIFPLVQYYSSRLGKRTLFHFYGPQLDCSNCLDLFRELIVTIAAAAQVRFGGFYRGSGASYAEGYVEGLPRSRTRSSEVGRNATPGVSDDSQALIAARSLIARKAAKDWLYQECGIQLVSSTKYSRNERDFAAQSLGKQHGATHEIKPGNRPLGIGHKK